ncbi:MAG: GIDE domain-containing protein [Putridiphycobacter sp.]|nr:GIDE domain-containing protein [Putridiphycobacter sp.]
MVFLILGIILTLIGVFLLTWSKKAAGKSMSIASTDITDTRNLLETYESMSNAHGTGHFNMYVKLYGKAYADKPLIAEYSKSECIYYSIKVDREYEAVETKTDKEGKVTQQRVRRFENVLDKEFYAPGFAVHDQYGRIRISHNNAKLETIESYATFEREESQEKIRLPFNFEGLIRDHSGAEGRTIGYKHMERSIPVGYNLFVVGTATDSRGELEIAKANEADKPFLISIKSEAEIMADLIRSSKRSKGWGYGLIGIGLAGLIFGILQKMGLF